MVSATSPWSLDQTILDARPHYIPVSHGEGRIVISDALAKELFENGQVYSQYCDENGIPTMAEPDNPNGSAYAIEGLTSPDGLVLGKMGHSERRADGDYINIYGDKNQLIMESGVEYFK